jgi:hypothetical protein
MNEQKFDPSEYEDVQDVAFALAIAERRVANRLKQIDSLNQGNIADENLISELDRWMYGIFEANPERHAVTVHVGHEEVALVPDLGTVGCHVISSTFSMKMVAYDALAHLGGLPEDDLDVEIPDDAPPPTIPIDSIANGEFFDSKLRGHPLGIAEANAAQRELFDIMFGRDDEHHHINDDHAVS